MAVANSMTQVERQAFSAMGSTITVGGTWTENAGAFNGNTSSMTVAGNVTFNGGGQALGTSVISIGGNPTLKATMNCTSCQFNLTGTGKILNADADFTIGLRCRFPEASRCKTISCLSEQPCESTDH